MSKKSPFSSVTLLGALTAAAGLCVSVSAIDPAVTGRAFWAQVAGLVLVAIGRLRIGDISLTKLPFVGVMLCAMSLSLAACQSVPAVATQKGPETGAQTGGVTPSAPVDQHGVLIVAPTLVFGGGSADEGGKYPNVTVTVGPAANGDVKGLGKQETGPQTSTQSASQTQTATQTNDLSGIAQAAADILKTAAPGSLPTTLAQKAIDAVKVGDAAGAKAALEQAKAAAAVVTPTEPVPPKQVEAPTPEPKPGVAQEVK